MFSQYVLACEVLFSVCVCFSTNQPWQGQSLQMKGELGSPRLGLSPCHIFCHGIRGPQTPGYFGNVE